MPWARRNNRLVFYRSVRHGGRPCKVYVGAGPDAEEAAAAVEQRKAQRQADAVARQEEQARYQAAVGPLDELCALASLVMRAVLEGLGFHQHNRGPWRRRRYARDGSDADLPGGLEGPAGARRPG
jgi:hypothetical protein